MEMETLNVTTPTSKPRRTRKAPVAIPAPAPAPGLQSLAVQPDGVAVGVDSEGRIWSYGPMYNGGMTRSTWAPIDAPFKAAAIAVATNATTFALDVEGALWKRTGTDREPDGEGGWFFIPRWYRVGLPPTQQ